MNGYSLLTPLPISGFGNPLQGGVLGPVVNVRDKGAKGDGKADDRAAIQAAVDAIRDTGGTVIVPPGDYRIDVTVPADQVNNPKSIELCSNILFLMDPAATLAVLPTSIGRYVVLKIWGQNNVRIVGGRLVGERRRHTGTAGEQGYGINIQGSNNVIVSNIHLSDFWGDGIWIGALPANANLPDRDITPSTNILVDRVVSNNNRRQGISIGPAENVVITNSTFSGSNGAKPEAGIDIEPQRQGFTRNITINHCIMTRNRGCGIEMHGNIIGISIDNCLFSDNFGYGVLTKEEKDMEEKEPTGLVFSYNTITRNGLEGMIISGSSDCVHIINNHMASNGMRFPISQPEDETWWGGQATGIAGGEDGEIAAGENTDDSVLPQLAIRTTTSNVSLRDNTFTPK